MQSSTSMSPKGKPAAELAEKRLPPTSPKSPKKNKSYLKNMPKKYLDTRGPRTLPPAGGIPPEWQGKEKELPKGKWDIKDVAIEVQRGKVCY